MAKKQYAGLFAANASSRRAAKKAKVDGLTKTLKIFRLLRVARMFRLLRIQRIFNRLECAELSF